VLRYAQSTVEYVYQLICKLLPTRTLGDCETCLRRRSVFIQTFAIYFNLYILIFNIYFYCSSFLIYDDAQERSEKCHAILNLSKHRRTCAVQLVQQRLLEDKSCEANNRLHIDAFLRTSRNTKFINIVRKVQPRLTNTIHCTNSSPVR
jgi:hypothetical protein